MVNSDRCNESCNTLDDLSSRTCVPTNTVNINLHCFSCDYKYKCDGIKCNANQKWNENLCRCE